MRCSECGVEIVGNHLAVCRYAPEPITMELETYRDSPNYTPPQMQDLAARDYLRKYRWGRP